MTYVYPSMVKYVMSEKQMDYQCVRDTLELIYQLLVYEILDWICNLTIDQWRVSLEKERIFSHWLF